jgi:mannose-6-phosphate isomerase-like protein (cupin superfamily)
MVVGLEVYEWAGEGYKPLHFSKGWQVALLNWEPLFDRKNLNEIERHNESDEAFVLLKGRAVLFTRPEGGELKAVEMESGVIYNVPRAVWHNLVATRDVKFLIVENRGTHLDDTEIRSITQDELSSLDAQLPEWAT